MKGEAEKLTPIDDGNNHKEGFKYPSIYSNFKLFVKQYCYLYYQYIFRIFAFYFRNTI